MNESIDGKPHWTAVLLDTFCWIVGTLHVIYGLAFLVAVSGNEAPDVLQMAGGAIMLPAILSQISARFAVLRRAWVPIFYGLILLPVLMLAIGSPTPQPLPQPAASKVKAAPEATQIAPKQSKSASRFEEVPSGHMLRPVQDALNAGDIDRSLSLLSERNAVDPADRALKQRLIDAIQLASDEQIARDPAADYAERIEAYWLPQVEALPATAPDDDEAFGKLRTRLIELAINIGDVPIFDLTPAQAAKRRKVVVALAAKQRALYPSMRERYAKALDAKLFRRDIRVDTEGAGATTLLITGGAFSFNANIEDVHRTLVDAASSLRFKKVSYRWSAKFDDRTTYSLPTPADGVVSDSLD